MKYSAILIAFFTTLVQCYDYALFGLSAAVLSKVFMSNCSSEEQLQNFFAVFSAAVIMKPVGAIIFGKIADKYGRATSVKFAAATAALSTTLIGLTPGFDYLGWWATGILTFCRMIFLMSLAGEIDTTRIYISEKMGSNKNFANGILSFCSQSGALLAAISYHYATKSEIPDLWRLNFIIGGSLGGLILLMRNYFQESEEFLKYKASRKNFSKDSSDKLLNIITLNKSKFITSLLISGCAGGIYHFLIIFFGTFNLKILNAFTREEAQLLNIILISTYSFAALISGWLADRIYPFKQIKLAIIISFILALVLQIIFINDLKFAKYAIIVLVGLMPFYTVPLHIIIQSLFTVEIRVRMCSLSHALGGMIFSSTTPFLCMLIWRYTHSLNLVLAYFMMLVIVILGAVFYLRARLLSAT
jgi:MHS family proline/betaine transporter-like MFS transporter